MATTQTTDRDRERTGQSMSRVTVRMPDQQVEEIDELIDAGTFPNRSEAIRAAIRDLLADRDGS